MPGRAVVAHSGGPTSVINSSLFGVIEEASEHPEIQDLYGARFGLSGVLGADFIDLLRQSRQTLEGIRQAPASALGTSRHEVREQDIEQVLRVFEEHNVRFFFYTGGNGSMGTAQQIYEAAKDKSYDLRVVGIPKTIDNDLMETDHTPGYAPAARFFACAVRDIGADNRALPNQVEIVEVLGRNAGWIVAATALARSRDGDGPHLIYFPEERLPLAKFLDDVERVYARHKRCVAAVCEGQLDQDGSAFGADIRSGSRGSLAQNLGHRLAMLVAKELGLRARSEKPGLLGRSHSAYVVERDREEAEQCGRAAVRRAVSGEGGVMVTLGPQGSPSGAVSTGVAPLSRVAFQERLLPAAFRNERNNDVTAEFLRYAAPLVGDIPGYASLDEV
jgi:ATP-dependent phosphofructokinase / diphosphate-dependent phosphofructokinase